MERTAIHPSRHTLYTSVAFAAIVVAGCSTPQASKIEVAKVKAVVQQWSDAHDRKDPALLNSLYDSQVMFYGKQKPKATCIQIKMKTLNAAISYSQSIVEGPSISFYSTQIVRCDFTRRIVLNNSTRHYQAYLLLRKVDNAYKIQGESDLLSDRNTGYSPNLGTRVRFLDGGGNKIDRQRLLWLMPSVLALIVLVYVFRSRSKRKVQQALHGSNLREPIGDHRTPEQRAFHKAKGHLFEGFVGEKFDRKFFTLEILQSDRSIGEHFPESNKNPDMTWRFSYQDFTRRFAVECKYRRQLLNGFELRPDQVDRYRKYGEEQKIDVYVAIGTGNTPDNPAHLYLVPLSEFDGSNLISPEKLAEFSRSTVHKFNYDRKLDCLR